MTTLGRPARVLVLGTFGLAAALLALLVLEGLSSAVIVLRKWMSGKAQPVAERLHTRYDAELGWVHEPNVFVRDMYGEGVYLKTNAQGLRGNVDVAVPAPADKLRVVCSGDSFTLGYGVDNDHTWCQSLATIDGRIDPINMGQGGYGVDQAYLWYRRDGVKLQPDIHLFAFINDDFNRMQRSSFLGYGKPTLGLRNDALVVENFPVPGRTAQAAWVTRTLPVLRELRTFQLAAGLDASRKPQGSPEQRAHTRQVALKVFESLRSLASSTGGALVLVYLPTLEECRGRPRMVDWWSALKPEILAAGFTVIDLTDVCQQLSAPEVETMFIREDEVSYPAAAGHYSAAGNRIMAQAIYSRVFTDAAAKQRLDSRPPRPQP